MVNLMEQIYIPKNIARDEGQIHIPSYKNIVKKGVHI